jgi:hypothetical protein
MPSTKRFDTKHHQEYYKDWIYLGTIGAMDYYLEAVPTSAKTHPCTSIVYGEEPHQYISTTISVLDMLETNTCIRYVRPYLETEQYHMLYLITLVKEFIRGYATQES